MPTLRIDETLYDLLTDMEGDADVIPWGRYHDYELTVMELDCSKRVNGLVHLRGDTIYAGANKIRLGRLLKLIGLEDNIIRIISERWKYHFHYTNPAWKVKVTDKVDRIYNMEHGEHGTLSASCMRYMGEYYRGLMQCYPIKIAYIVEGDNLIARALLWNKVYCTFSRPIKFMDRIFSVNLQAEHTMLKWAEENKYWTLDEQIAESNRVKSPYAHVYHDKELLVFLEKHIMRYKYKPFLDTFHDYSCKKKALHSCNNYSADWVFNDTDGGVDRVYAHFSPIDKFITRCLK